MSRETASTGYTGIPPEDPSKVSGVMNKAAGAIKENVGYAFGAKGMEMHGAEQRAAGQAELDLARQQAAAEGMAKQMEGASKEAYGDVAGRPTTSVSGTAERLTGEAQERINK